MRHFVSLLGLLALLGCSETDRVIYDGCIDGVGFCPPGGAGGDAGSGGQPGTGGDPGFGGDAGSGGGSDVCRGPLDEYCSECASYDEAFAASFQDYEVCSDDGPPNSLPAAGTCDEYPWILYWDVVDTHVEYFDSEGTMVGATFQTDVSVLCDDSSSGKEFGFVPDCERVTTARACEPEEL